MKYDLSLTMLDGKAINAITGTTSTSSCNLCLAKPSEMNNIDFLLQKEIVNPEAIEHGLSILHCWIRFFEFILHIGYKLDIKKWMARTEEEKRSVSTRKEKIKKDFRKHLNLVVDSPRVGAGNSNDGNTARKSFQHSDIFSKITGVNKMLIDMLYCILQVLSSNREIDVQLFEFYCLRTARKIVELYPWYKIPSSLHKILIHGGTVIKRHLYPIGIYSEECQESLHKIVRNTRLNHSRKTSRLNTMKDLLHYLLVHSDPLISTLRKKEHGSKLRELSEEARSLLKISEEMEELSLSSDEEEGVI